MKKKKLTKTEQRVAAEILTRFMFIKNIDEFWEEWNKTYDEYELMDDPFTHTPVSPEDWAKNRLEYDKQVMIERYGHCDGLE